MTSDGPAPRPRTDGPPGDDDRPRVIGGYVVRRRLGEGSFGKLLLAEAANGDEVVIKQLKVDRLIDDKSLALFQREAGVLRSLRHPAVPRFLDSGIDDDGIPYLIQEYIEGQTLEAAVVSGHRFDTSAAERLARDLLEALDYLHGLHPPVIHRDIKPANIVLHGARPVIVDFGAVCGHAVLAGEASDTVVGTFGYMAPEMLKGLASAAADLYSLGATLLFAFSGREPESFPTEGLRLQFRGALTLPDRLANLIEALLEPAVQDRPKSADRALAILAPSGPATDDRGTSRQRERGALTASGQGQKTVSKRRFGPIARGLTGAMTLAVVAGLLVLGPSALLAWLRPIAMAGGIILVVLFIIVSILGLS